MFKHRLLIISSFVLCALQASEDKALSSRNALLLTIRRYDLAQVAKALKKDNPLMYVAMRAWYTQMCGGLPVDTTHAGVAKNITILFFPAVHIQSYKAPYPGVSLEKLAAFQAIFESLCTPVLYPPITSRAVCPKEVREDDRLVKKLLTPSTSCKPKTLSYSRRKNNKRRKGLLCVGKYVILKALPTIAMQNASPVDLATQAQWREAVQEDQVTFYEKIYRENPLAIPAKPSVLQKFAIARLRQ